MSFHLHLKDNVNPQKCFQFLAGCIKTEISGWIEENMLICKIGKHKALQPNHARQHLFHAVVRNIYHVF